LEAAHVAGAGGGKRGRQAVEAVIPDSEDDDDVIVLD
jgi:hypothetical protein